MSSINDLTAAADALGAAKQAADVKIADDSTIKHLLHIAGHLLVNAADLAARGAIIALIPIGLQASALHVEKLARDAVDNLVSGLPVTVPHEDVQEATVTLGTLAATKIIEKVGGAGGHEAVGYALADMAKAGVAAVANFIPQR